MDIPKLSYAKLEGVLEPSEEELYTALSEISDSFDVKVDTSTTSDNYQKPMPVVEVVKIFVISGGESREPDYFKLLRKMKGLKRILVLVRSKKGQGLQPFQMSAMAERFYVNKEFETENGDTFELSDTDTIYMLTDVDEYAIDLQQRIQNVPTQQLWIVSNPCFEIWLFYHRFDTPSPLLDEGLTKDVSQRSKWLKHRLHGLGPIDSAKALLEMPTAIRNSKANYRVDPNGLPATYATQMHQFAEVLLDAITKDEFETMIKQQREKAEYYRRRAYVRKNKN